jgi:hypothetical protein
MPRAAATGPATDWDQRGLDPDLLDRALEVSRERTKKAARAF